MLQTQQYSFVSVAFLQFSFKEVKRRKKKIVCVESFILIYTFIMSVLFISSYGLELLFGIIPLLQYACLPYLLHCAIIVRYIKNLYMISLITRFYNYYSCNCLLSQLSEESMYFFNNYLHNNLTYWYALFLYVDLSYSQLSFPFKLKNFLQYFLSIDFSAIYPK